MLQHKVGKGTLKVCSNRLRTMELDDVLIGKRRLKVGLGRLGATEANELLVGNGRYAGLG